MRLRVVGGPIKREDRVIIETTMHTTFDAILSAVHAEVERLDQIDLLAHEIKRSDLGGGGFSLPTATAPVVTDSGSTGQDSAAHFGAEVDVVGDSDSDGDDCGTTKTVAAAPAAADTPAKPASGDRLQQQEQRGSARAASAAVPSVCATRLQQYPIDSQHYDVALFELDKDRKPSITRPCRPRDTPSSVKLHDPVIAIFLKSALQQKEAQSQSQSTPKPDGGSTVSAMSPPAHFGSPSPISGGGTGLAAASPISPLVRRQPSTAGLLRATPSSFRHLGGADTNGSRSSFRRSTSSLTDLTPILQSNATLHRCMILYRISRSDWTRTTAMERLLNRLGGKRRERFLEVANEALLPHSAPSEGCGDALLGVSFHLQNIRQFLAVQLQRLDPRTSEESASMFADMVVHASPMGDEKSFSAVFLARYVQDTYQRFSQQSAVASARRFWFRKDDDESAPLTQWSVPCTILEVQQWEVLHRFVLVRMLVASEWALVIHGTLLRWLRAAEYELLLETRRPCRGLPDLDHVVPLTSDAAAGVPVSVRRYDHLDSAVRLLTANPRVNLLSVPILPCASCTTAPSRGNVAALAASGGAASVTTIRRGAAVSGHSVPLHAPVPKRSIARAHAAAQQQPHVDPCLELSPSAPARGTATESREVSPMDELSTATRSPSNLAAHAVDGAAPAVSTRVAALEVEVSRMRAALEAQTKMLCELLQKQS